MNEPLFLGIDTSTRWRSIGLINEQGLLASISVHTTQGHGKNLLSRIETLFSELNRSLDALRCVGIVNGPGSFTALRVGVATAQGLGLGLGIPVVPVGTHEAIVCGLPEVREQTALILVPARKGEVFAQLFVDKEGIGWQAKGVVNCIPVEELPEMVDKPGLLAGPALHLYGVELEALYEGRVPLAPIPGRHARGETVAEIARERLEKGTARDYPADKIEILYLQSHGALTIQERERIKQNAVR